MFIEQIRRFARDVLPALKAHRVERVPALEAMAAEERAAGAEITRAQ
jgi:hypothetical protein